MLKKNELELRGRIAKDITQVIASGNTGHAVWLADFSYSKSLKGRWIGGCERRNYEGNKPYFYEPLQVTYWAICYIRNFLSDINIDDGVSFSISMAYGQISLEFDVKGGLTKLGSQFFPNVSDKV